MPLPSKRDHAVLRERLARWLERKLPRGAKPRVSELSIPAGTGMSSETLLFDAEWSEVGVQRSGRFVVRMSPDMNDYPVFPSYDLALQYRCLELVRRHTDVPVPRPLWLELDPEPLGASFFVMERVDGQAPPDMLPYVFGSWLTEATPEQRTRLQRSSIRVLARLHTLHPRAVDLGFLERPRFGATPLEQHLGAQRAYYDWAREGEVFPILERLFAWLDAHRPQDPRPPVLNWGDARIGNILYRDFEPVAVLDWEMAALGAPEVDLAWMVFMHRFFANLAEKAGLPGLPGFLERADIAATYEELSRRKVRDLEFWEVFAALRYGIVSLRTSARGIAYGQQEKPADPEDRVMIRDLIEQMLSGEYWS